MSPTAAGPPTSPSEGPAGEVREVVTPHGPARVHLSTLPGGLLVLGHGAGGTSAASGGPGAPDLLAAARAAARAGLGVALVEQPWRVAGRRVATAPPTLDAAWLAVCADLGPQPLLVVGGRSAGARVACRTAEAVGADAVLCLAFPLHPPSRPERSRAVELALPRTPVLVVQGSRDAFGVPEGAVVVEGADHGFATRRGVAPAAPQVEAVVLAWLQGLAPRPG